MELDTQPPQQPAKPVSESTTSSATRKNEAIYWVLIFLPLIAMVVSILLQIATRFAFGGSSTVVNLVNFLLGIAMVLSFVLLPLWIILLVKAKDHNKRLN